jgi:alkanesulfonate monooxygenase SsuD/methylene tetrahydromethanopterin reductase-like flavin-dependent oxidoreductase (luciferase family)
MLALTGRLADGWIPSSSYAPPERLAEMQDRINAAAQAAGRNPSAIRRAYNLMGRITDGPARGQLDGPADYWIDELTRFTIELGMDTFLYWPSEDRLRQVQMFGAEVAPAVREAVARERGGG